MRAAISLLSRFFDAQPLQTDRREFNEEIIPNETINLIKKRNIFTER